MSSLASSRRRRATFRCASLIPFSGSVRSFDGLASPQSRQGPRRGGPVEEADEAKEREGASGLLAAERGQQGVRDLLDVLAPFAGKRQGDCKATARG
ncbi:MAG TPA: hypothetical protein VGQ65_19405 [Thermoanaerobaculia bacterium]|nr:hypothetical protein [Thermoanaerobaculia bacterium]